MSATTTHWFSHSVGIVERRPGVRSASRKVRALPMAAAWRGTHGHTARAFPERSNVVLVDQLHPEQIQALATLVSVGHVPAVSRVLATFSQTCDSYKAERLHEHLRDQNIMWYASASATVTAIGFSTIANYVATVEPVRWGWRPLRGRIYGGSVPPPATRGTAPPS